MILPTVKNQLLLVVVFASILFPSLAAATILTADTTWQGEVTLTEDVLVPSSVTLTIKPGTLIRVIPSESTKTDPEYSSPLTEITVRGKLSVDGTSRLPVSFVLGNADKSGLWAGIIVDGGVADFQHCRISNAETAVYVIGGDARIHNCELSKNRYGVSGTGGISKVLLSDSTVTDNDYGIVLLNDAHLTNKNSGIKNNRKKDVYTISVPQSHGQPAYAANADLPVSKVLGDQVLLGTTVWQGRVVVNGSIRVPEGARLYILPGSIIEFGRKDSNGDGIGENGLLIQGTIIAKGTAREPIIFRSSEKQRREGDWDAINIMNSDGVQNLIEYCQIEDAYHALHFHFSNIAVTNSILKHNYRAIQFQESTVLLRDNRVYENKSGIQGRNSAVIMSGNIISNNYMGGNFFRSSLQIRQNKVVGNLKEGLRLREGATVMEENLVDGNRYGVMVADTFAGRFTRNVVTNNAEIGLSVKNADNIEVSANFVAANGLNGISLQDVRAEIRGNQIAENGERGIGIISFTGVISGNNLMDNRLFAIDNEGKNEVDATANWWGGAAADAVIFDAKDDPSRGRVVSHTALAGPVPFHWPLADVSTPAIWGGEMSIDHRVEVTTDATLTIKPGTRVAFAEGAGLTVLGKFLAKGEQNKRIVFTSLRRMEPGAWDEVLLEHANDSVIANATFEYANWGLHSHFTNLSLSDSEFRHNSGGMRFRSGPVSIAGCLFTANGIGLRSYMGNATIQDSTFTGNEIGVFVREKGSGLHISRSNLYKNSDYNIRVGDFNDEDVDARGNWWGGAAPASTIFDGRNEAGIGNVIYEPILQKPVENLFTGGLK